MTNYLIKFKVTLPKMQKELRFINFTRLLVKAIRFPKKLFRTSKSDKMCTLS